MNELRRLRPLHPKLDMQDIVIDEIATPPSNPEECIFARTIETISTDFKTQITPCQFGGDSRLLAMRMLCLYGTRRSGRDKVSAGSLPVTSSWRQIGLAKGGVKRRRRSRRNRPRRPSKPHSRSCQLTPSRDRQEQSLERKWMHDRRRIAARTGEIQQVAVTPRVYSRNLRKPFGTSRLAKTAGYANWR